MSQDAILQMTGISKRFGGVRALSDVDFSVRAGEVHALMGENGAGKSTLIRILAGVHAPDHGAIHFMGRAFHPRTPADAVAGGISVIHQELNLIPTLSIAENLLLGRIPRRWHGLDWGAARTRARQVLRRLGLDVDVDRRLDACPAAVRQMVAIGRAISVESRLIVMDEPTSSLDRAEARNLLRVVRELSLAGVAVIFISHALNEVYDVSDRMTVLRNGRVVGAFETAGLPRVALVRLMLGRPDAAQSSGSTPGQDSQERVGSGERGSDRDPCTEGRSSFSDCGVGRRARPPVASPLLVVRNLARRLAMEPISFQLHSGEVLGLTGLLGSGRTETARMVFGADRPDSGAMTFEGQPIARGGPSHSIRLGMGFCPEDRGTEGVIPDLSVRENICLVIQRRLSRWGRVSRAVQRRLSQEMIERLDIAATDPEQPVGQLSGGNQQKVVLARWLVTRPRLLILDEPTRGIDVGAKQAVEALVARLSAQGMALIFISSELDEVLRASDRVLVLHDRRLAGLVQRGEADARAILRLMSGGSEQDASGGNASVNNQGSVRMTPGSAQAEFANHWYGRPPQASPSLPDGSYPPGGAPSSGAIVGAVQDHDEHRPRLSRPLPTWLLPLVALGALALLNFMLMPQFAHLEIRDGRIEGAIVQTLRQAAPVMILSVGMTLVIALGGIDLSVGSIMAMSGAAAAVLLTQRGWSTAGIIGAGLAVGLLAGAWNAALVSLLRIPAIIATLILLVAGRGLAQLPTGGLVVTFESPGFEGLARGTLLGLPMPVYLAFGTTLLVAAVTRFTAIGLYLEAVGASRPASYLCGMRLRTLEFTTYLLCGFCAALAGLLVTADTKAADVSTCGLYLELDAILAVVIGGTKLTGGRIRLFGSIIGALLMQTLTTTLLMADAAPAHALLIKGGFALAVCLIQSPRRSEALSGLRAGLGTRFRGAGSVSARCRRERPEG